MKVKQLFRGAFNANGFPKILYAHAYTERQAWAVMCKRMAKQDGVSAGAVMSLFDGSRDNYQITQEIAMREVE